MLMRMQFFHAGREPAAVRLVPAQAQAISFQD